MSLLGCLGPWISTSIIMYFCFMHNQGGRLYIHRVTCQVLWLLLMSPKGFIPSILSPNLMFLTSFSKFGYVLSTSSTAIHQQGVLALCLPCHYCELCAIASTGHALCSQT